MGHLLIFEGIDGSGKSTQIALMKQFLIENGETVLTTREPGGTAFGEKCRTLFLSHNISGLTELFIALASRDEHISKKIKPALEQGSWVLCDRFTDSTIAYQGWGRGIPLDLIINVSNLIEKDLSILKVIFLKISYQSAVQRIQERGLKSNRFDLNLNDKKVIKFPINYNDSILEYAYKILQDNNFVDAKIIDLRINNKIIKNEQ